MSNDYPLPGLGSIYTKRFEEGNISLERRRDGAVVLYFTRGGKAGPPDEHGVRHGMVAVQQFDFTPDEWREVERKLQIAK
jgi:hypothetical protein